MSTLWRYPVKSLRGEPMQSLELSRRGIAGDRQWALVGSDGGIASGKPTRRFRKIPDLMLHASRLDRDVPVIELSDGRSVRGDDAAMVGIAEELAGPGWRLAREGTVSHLDVGPVSLLTTSTLRAISERALGVVEAVRLRPNILIDSGQDVGFVEDDWVGRELAIGEVRLRVSERTERCAMTNHAQKGLPYRGDVLRTIGRINDTFAGVYAEVIRDGNVAVGDPVTLK